MKYVVTFRSKMFTVELPNGEIPITINFDDSKVVGRGVLGFNEKGNLVADILINEDYPFLDTLKPTVSFISTSGVNDIPAGRVTGISLCTENQDPEIKSLGDYGS